MVSDEPVLTVTLTYPTGETRTYRLIRWQEALSVPLGPGKLDRLEVKGEIVGQWVGGGRAAPVEVKRGVRGE